MDHDTTGDKELTRARNAAYRYLSIRARSRVEVAQKLKEKGFSGSLADSVVRDLVRLGYVNDREFALQWIRSRVRLRGFGRRRIEQELKDKGIDRDLIHESLNSEFDESPEIDIAQREAAKKLRSLGRFEPEVRRRRLAGHLERKGFSSSTIGTVLRSIE